MTSRRPTCYVRHPVFIESGACIDIGAVLRRAAESGLALEWCTPNVGQEGECIVWNPRSSSGHLALSVGPEGQLLRGVAPGCVLRLHFSPNRTDASLELTSVWHDLRSVLVILALCAVGNAGGTFVPRLIALRLATVVLAGIILAVLGWRFWVRARAATLLRAFWESIKRAGVPQDEIMRDRHERHLGNEGQPRTPLS